MVTKSNEVGNKKLYLFEHETKQYSEKQNYSIFFQKKKKKLLY